MNLILIESSSKHFKVLNRQEGLTGAVQDLFNSDYQMVKTFDEIPFDPDINSY